MEQPSRSSYRSSASAALLALLLVGCAGNPTIESATVAGPPVVRAGSAEPFLLELREYIGLPAGEQAAERRRLKAAAANGPPSARLHYALALSVDRDDRDSLETAREHFRALLSAPDPLPVALDTLVRLQMGQVIDRLERMARTDAILRAGQATAAALDTCRLQLRNRDDELAGLREKLHALTRIEQAVEDNQDATRANREEDDDANR